MTASITVKIARLGPDEKKPRLESYRVPRDKVLTVLDALAYIRKHLDPTLAYRANCRAGRCGSDAMEVNGVPVLACKTVIPENVKEMTVSPMRAFPAVRDLVPDFSEAFEYAREIPCFTPKKSRGRWRIQQKEIQEIRELRKCIECFICHDACHVIREHKGPYIGPRFVIKAAGFDKHPMDAIRGRTGILKEKGIWLCNISRCCQQLCPEKIRIVDDGIIYAKESAVDANVNKLLKRKKK